MIFQKPSDSRGPSYSYIFANGGTIVEWNVKEIPRTRTSRERKSRRAEPSVFHVKLDGSSECNEVMNVERKTIDLMYTPVNCRPTTDVGP